MVYKALFLLNFFLFSPQILLDKIVLLLSRLLDSKGGGFPLPKDLLLCGNVITD